MLQRIKQYNLQRKINTYKKSHGITTKNTKPNQTNKQTNTRIDYKNKPEKINKYIRPKKKKKINKLTVVNTCCSNNFEE